ncbi:MAG TPA: acyltransferase [Pirellulales bacterium]|nr:acyltransferase [Pirellulales bacterium]
MTTTTFEFPEVQRTAAVPAAPGARHTMLDVCRLLAAYAIVWLHTPRPQAWADLGLLGRFAVPFFTAAATFFAWQAGARSGERSVTRYAWSRVLRIYVPFLAWSGIYLAFKGAKAILLPAEPNDFPGWELLWLGSFYHLWFMPFVLLATLTVFCLARMAAGRRGCEITLGILALVAGWQIAWLPADRAAAEVGFGRLALDALPSACWGVALAIAYRSRARSWLANRRVAMACLLVAVGGTLALLATGRNACLENVAGAALVVFTLTDWTSAGLERIARLGSLAYGIYLSHLLFIKTLEAVLGKLHVAPSLASGWAIFVGAAAGSTLLAWLLGRWRATRWLTAS